MKFINMKDTDQRKRQRKYSIIDSTLRKFSWDSLRGLFLKLDAENLSRCFSSSDTLDVAQAQSSHKVIILFTLAEVWISRMPRALSPYFMIVTFGGSSCYTAVHTVLTVNSVSLAMMSVGWMLRSYMGFSNVARPLVFSWPT